MQQLQTFTASRKIKNPRRSNRSCPCLEYLEGRLAPAGNVNVTPAFDGTTLIMGGDDLGNHVLIRSGDTAGEIVIEGIDGEGELPLAEHHRRVVESVSYLRELGYFD